MRRKELWRKAKDAAAPPEKGAKQYKYLYRRMLEEETIRKVYETSQRLTSAIFTIASA